MLAEVRAAGSRRYNGRARSRVEALARAGLVAYDFGIIPHGLGDYTQLYVVWPAGGRPPLGYDECQGSRRERGVA